MTEQGSLVLPTIGGDDRVDTGMAEPIEVACMYNDRQYLPLCGRFKPKTIEGQFNEKEISYLQKLSAEEKDDGVASAKIYTFRFDNPVDPYNSTYENVRRRGVCESAMTMQFKMFTFGLEVGNRLYSEYEGDVKVDDKEMNSEEIPKTINYQCAIHRRPCWCESTDPELCRPILDQCTAETPLPLTISCPFQMHTGRCFCLTGTDDDSSNFASVEVDHLNRLATVEEQRQYLLDHDVFVQEIGASSPFEREEAPIVLLEMIPREDANTERPVIENTEIPLAFRFIYILPENSTLNFGGTIQSMIEEYGGSKKRKSFNKLNQYQQHRTVISRHRFLELIGSCMWGNKVQYTNPQLNKDFPLITTSAKHFIEGLNQILLFKGDLNDVCSSTSSIDKVAKNWQEVLHKDSCKDSFTVGKYFQNDKFCPIMKLQRNMLVLDPELLKVSARNDQHVLIRKYNLWHYLEQKEYYDRRRSIQEGDLALNPTNATVESTSGIQRNPQSTNSELNSIESEIMASVDEKYRNQVRHTVKRWFKGQEGAGLNTFRYRQYLDLMLYEDEGRHLTTNEERRQHYCKWVETSIKGLKRYSARSDLFSSTRGAMDYMKKMKGVWNPLSLGFSKFPAASLDVGGLFIAELFYVSETLFYVSTHTGILFFCYVATADAFCTRLNKNNWIFVGSPDAGKSYTSNKVKDAMLIPETILMKTKQSDAALDDVDVMDCRNLMEEANMNLWYKNPKYTRIQDEEKNRLTSGVSISVKKMQFKGDDDIVRWHTQQIVTIHSMQIGCSTNETQLEKKCIAAMLSRVPMKDMPKIKRTKGRRAVSDMNSAQSQQSASKKRMADLYMNKYRYYDSLRFLVYKCLNLGILVQPTRTGFDMILDKLKAYLKGLGISLDSRTEDRCYGKAMSLMILRVLSSLFEIPKPSSKLIIVATPYSDTDPWTMQDDEFKYKMHDEDLQRILENPLQENFENIRFIDATGRVVRDKLFVKVSSEKAFDEKRCCIFNLRPIQCDPSGNRFRSSQNSHCPKTLVGEFYRQSVSIHHANFSHFVKSVNPLMTISLEDSVRAIWLSRSEFVPDKYILFNKLLTRLGINCLKKEVLTKVGDDKKRKAMFKTSRVEVDSDSDYNTNYSYIKLGKLKEVVSVLAADNSGKTEESNSYPDGFEVYFDKLTIKDMLEDLKSVKDTQGYFYKTPSRINQDNEPFWGVVNVCKGRLPEWSNVTPEGKVANSNEQTMRERLWRGQQLPKSFSKANTEEQLEWAKAAFAKRQRQLKKYSCNVTNEEWEVSTKHCMPVIEITESSHGGVKDTSDVYLNINWIEKGFKDRNKKLEDINPLILFFQSLGYRYDGIKITEAQRKVFAEKCKVRFEKMKAGEEDVEKIKLYKEVYDSDLKRLKEQTLPEGSPDSDAGRKILLGSPFLGYTIDEHGNKDERTCTPQLSMSVTIHHTEDMWFTEAANVPSAKATQMLNLPESDAEKKRLDLVLPINDFAAMTRLDALCILVDGAKVEDYKALYDYKCSRGFFPYRFASPDWITHQIHEDYLNRNEEYMFSTHYPHCAAYHEEKSYDCKRVLMNGKWVWVKYDFLKQKKATENSLRPELQKLLEDRFGRAEPEILEPEIIPFEEEMQRMEKEVERDLDNMILENMQEEHLTEEDLFGISDEDEPAEQGSGKRARFS